MGKLAHEGNMESVEAAARRICTERPTLLELGEVAEWLRSRDEAIRSEARAELVERARELARDWRIAARARSEHEGLDNWAAGMRTAATSLEGIIGQRQGRL